VSTGLPPPRTLILTDFGFTAATAETVAGQTL